MWSLKFTVVNIDSIYTQLTKKYKVIDYLYPLDVYVKNQKFHILGLHQLEGDKNNINKFYNELKKNKKIVNIERQKDLVMAEIKEEEKFYSLKYSSELYQPAPTIIKNGVEEWHLASWDRETLQKIIKEIEKEKTKLQDFQLLGIRKTNFSEIYYPKIMPDIPHRQEKAFWIAINNGYYKYPRKSNLGKLAKIMGVSLSTYQEHLRKAEAKLLPVFAKTK